MDVHSIIMATIMEEIETVLPTITPLVKIITVATRITAIEIDFISNLFYLPRIKK